MFGIADNRDFLRSIFSWDIEFYFIQNFARRPIDTHVFDYASTASQLCTFATQFTSASLTTRNTLIAIAIVHQRVFAVRPQLRRNLAAIQNTSFSMTTSTYTTTVGTL